MSEPFVALRQIEDRSPEFARGHLTQVQRPPVALFGSLPLLSPEELVRSLPSTRGDRAAHQELRGAEESIEAEQERVAWIGDGDLVADASQVLPPAEIGQRERAHTDGSLADRPVPDRIGPRVDQELGIFAEGFVGLRQTEVRL